jgi:hypothetical protein
MLVAAVITYLAGWSHMVIADTKQVSGGKPVKARENIQEVRKSIGVDAQGPR